LEGLLSLLPLPVFLKDAEGRYVDCNEAFSVFVGRRREELVGRTVEELWEPGLAEVYRRADEELMSRGGAQVYKADARRADGAARRLRYIKARVDAPGGRPLGIAGAMLDLTELEESERSRRELETRFSAFFENSPALASMLDAEGRIIHLNRAAAELLALDRESAKGRVLAEALPEEVRGEFLSRLAGVLAEGRAKRFLDDFKTPEGFRSYETTYFPIKGPTCGSGCVGIFGLDLSAEREAERRVRAMFDLMPQGVVWRKAGGPYLEANAAAAKILGLDPAKPSLEGFYPEAYDAEGRPVPPEALPSSRALAEGKPVLDEILAIRSRGVTRWVALSAYPILDAEGRAAETLIALNDVTALRRESSMKDELMREIHHRVKNNLALVASLLSVSASLASPEARHELSDAVARVESVASLYDLLALQGSYERVDAAEYLGRVVAAARVAASERRGAEIGFQGERILLAQKRAVHLGLVAAELVTNALKYAYPGGSGPIRVRLFRSGVVVVLRVEDEGVGVEGDDPAPGTGLTLVRSLVQGLEGELRFEGGKGPSPAWWNSPPEASARPRAGTWSRSRPGSTLNPSPRRAPRDRRRSPRRPGRLSANSRGRARGARRSRNDRRPCRP